MAIQAGDVIWNVTASLDGLKNGLHAGVGQVQSASQKIAAATRTIGYSFTALGGIITGALSGAIYKFATYGDEIAKAAKRTGLSTEAMSEFRHAVEQSGASLQAFEAGIKRMARVLLDAESGLKESQDSLSALGLTVDDFKGKTPEEAFMLFAEAIAGVDDELRQVALAQEIFGRSGTMMLPLINEGAAGIAALRQEARDLGIVLDTETATSAEVINDLFDEMKKAVMGLVVPIGSALAPHIKDLGERFKAIAQSIREWMEAHPELVAAIVATAGVVGSLMVAIGPLLVVLPGIVALAGAVAGAFSWVGAAVAGVAVGVGVVLVAAFTVLRNAMQWAVAWVKENWERIEATFKAAMDALRAWWGVLAELFRIGIDIIVIILEGLGLAIVDEYERITGDTKTFQGDFLDVIARLAENLKWAFEIIRADLMVVRVWLEQNWDSMVQGAQWFWTAIVRPIGNFIQLIERAITTWNRLRSIMPDRLISQMLGIPQMFASGGVVQALASGGIVDHRLVMVGERGPELAALPVGSRVMSYADMRAAVADGTRGSANETQVVIDLRGTVIQRDADADALLEKLSGLMTARFSAVGLQYG